MAEAYEDRLAPFYRNEAHEELIGPFFEELKKFFLERLGGECTIFCNKANSSNSDLFQLTLHLRHENSVGISRIEFKPSRQGHCESLIEFLDSVSDKYQIPLIEFLSVYTSSMKSFLKKHSFINAPPIKLYDDLVESSKNWYRLTPYGNREHKSSVLSTNGGMTFIGTKN